MATFCVGIRGCGRSWKSADVTGFGMAPAHGLSYTALPATTIVARADVNLDNARVPSGTWWRPHL